MAKNKQERLFEPDPEIPPSREVRLEDGALHGDLEVIAFGIRTGDERSFGRAINVLELTVELRRSKAVEAFKDLIRQKLLADGYIVSSDLDHIAEAWHESELE